jgi:DMSO reductase anchor subunit
MNPAFSVIFMTTLIGVGQGLFLAIYAAELLGLIGVLPEPDDRRVQALGSMIALAFLVVGLIASFFHLGHPERAWRAASRWRTSWLSREVIVLPSLMAAVFAYGVGQYFGGHGAANAAVSILTTVAGILAVILCIALFICTGMIYACIKFMQEWASPLTLINYFLMGTASGLTLATLFSLFVAPDLFGIFGIAAIIFTLAAFVGRAASLYRNARIKRKSTLQTATGIRHPHIVQKAQGAMGGSFNTREFFHGKAPAFVRSVKWIFLVLVFPVPILLLAAGLLTASAISVAAAFVLQYIGLVFERWFFFAQANHPQNLYYQQIS